MINFGTLIATLKIKDQLTPALKKAQQSLKNAGPRMKAVGRSMTMGVTVPLVAAGAAALAAGDTIEKAFRTISTATGATGEALAGLTASFTAVFTEVPQNAEVVAQALADINTISGATGTVLESLTQSVLDASRMLGEQAGPNAIGFARALEQFQRPAAEGTEILDRFFRISQETGSGLGDLIRSTNEYGGVLKNAGFSMEESAVLFGRLESSGISVSRVMPGLNAAFRKSAEAGEDSRAVLEKVVVSMKRAKSDTEALAIATEVFGAEGAQRMTVAVRNGTFALDDLTASLEGAEGGIQAASAESKTLSEVMATLRNKATAALAPFGDELKNVMLSFTPLLEKLSEHIADAAAWFSKLSPGVKQIIVIVVGLTAALGPVLMALGFLATGIAAVSLPVMGVVAAIAVVVAALFRWRKEIGSFIKKGINVFLNTLDAVKVRLGKMTAAEAAAAKAQRSFTEDVEEFVPVVTEVTDTLAAQAPALAQVVTELDDATGSTQKLNDATKELNKRIDAQVTAWRQGGIPAGREAMVAFAQLGGEISQLTDTEVSGLNNALSELIDKSIRTGRAVPQEAFDLWVKTLDRLNPRVMTLSEALEDMPTLPPDFLAIPQMPLDQALGSFKKLNAEVFKGKSAFGQWGDAVKRGFKNLWSGMTGGSGKISGLFMSLGSGIMDGFGQIISGGLSSLISTGVGLAMSGLGKLGSWMKGKFGVSEAEKEGRNLVKVFEDTVAASLSQTQLAEAGGESWKQTVVGVRDAYLSAGRSAEEAMADVERLWEATKQGPEAVEAVIKSMQGVMDLGKHIRDMESDWRGAEEAASRYGLSLDDLGPKFKAAKWAEDVNQLTSDWQLLNIQGAKADTIARKMAPAVQGVIDKYREAGIEIPASLRPVIEHQVEMGLLLDEDGKKITDLSSITFAAPLVDQFNSLISSIQGLVDTLTGRGGVTDALAEVNRTQIKDKSFTVTRQFESRGENFDAEFLRHGTGGRYVDFGAGTPAVLHGKERVMTEAEGKSEAVSMVGVEKRLTSIERLLRDQPRAFGVAVSDSLTLIN